MIQIDENWRFHRDTYNLILEEKKMVAETIDRKKTGRKREVWVEVGFFTSLHALFLHVLQYDASAATTAQEFDDRLEAMGDKILAAIKANPGGP